MTRAEQNALIERFRELKATGARPDPELASQLDRLSALIRERVRNYCTRRMADPQKAEEAAQEALARAFHRIPDFRGDSSFATWVFGFARFLCLEQARPTRDLLTDDGLLDELSSEQAVALRRLRAEECLELLRAAEQRLPSDQREAIVLRYEQECSQQEIDEIMELSTRTGSRGLLQTARRTLRRHLHEMLDELHAGKSLFQLSQS